MGREIRLIDLPEYTGAFSFDSSRLQTFIKAAKQDYDPADPKTWPIITSKYLRNWLHQPYDGHRMLPPFVAYNPELVTICTANRTNSNIQIERQDDTTMQRNLFFHHFPFSYKRNGCRSLFNFLHRGDYKVWVAGVVGEKIETREMDEAASGVSKSIFDEIFGMIRDTRYSRNDEYVVALKAELVDALEELAEQKEQANVAKARSDALEAERDGVMARAGMAEEECDRLEAALRDREDRFKASESLSAEALQATREESRMAKTQLGAKVVELASAKEEASVLKHQMTKIRDEMKRVREGGGNASSVLKSQSRKA